MQIVDFFGLFILLAGFVVGLGAVTVIDMHGFLARKSSYWTEATIRAHKITKPLIWLGVILATLGGFLFYKDFGLISATKIHLLSLLVLFLNGCFLSFYVSPFLLKRERDGKEKEILPSTLQNLITLSFVISFVFWWGNLGLLVYFLLNNL